jgi:hypothetical protein
MASPEKTIITRLFSGFTEKKRLNTSIPITMSIIISKKYSGKVLGSFIKLASLFIVVL